MHFYVIAPTGERYGPADLETLNFWIVDGRVGVKTLLEHVETGSWVSAGTVPGLRFGSSAIPPVIAPPPQPAPDERDSI